MTLEQLKAKAYDLLRSIDMQQRELQVLSGEIAKLEQATQNVTKDD